MGILEVSFIEMIQSGAAYLYRTGTRVDRLSKIIDAESLQEPSYSFVGPPGVSPSKRTLKV